MQFKVLTELNKASLQNQYVFSGCDEEILYILDEIELNFFGPEQVIMEQYDHSFRKLMITGMGVCNVYKYFDSRNRVCLGELQEGRIIGE